jgi:hypothetical protein
LSVNEISNRKNVFWVELFLDCPDHVCANDRVGGNKPLLSNLSYAVVVRDVAAVGQHFLACADLDVVERLHWVFQALREEKAWAGVGWVGGCQWVGGWVNRCGSMDGWVGDVGGCKWCGVGGVSEWVGGVGGCPRPSK